MKNIFLIYVSIFLTTNLKALDPLEDYTHLTPAVVQKKYEEGVKHAVQGGIGLLLLETAFNPDELSYGSKAFSHDSQFQLLSLPTARNLLLIQALSGAQEALSAIRYCMTTNQNITLTSLFKLTPTLNLLNDFSGLSEQDKFPLFTQGVKKTVISWGGMVAIKTIEVFAFVDSSSVSLLKGYLFFQFTAGCRTTLSAADESLARMTGAQPIGPGGANRKSKIILGCCELGIALLFYGHHASTMMMRAQAASDRVESPYIEMGIPSIALLGIVSLGYKGLKNVVYGFFGW